MLQQLWGGLALIMVFLDHAAAIPPLEPRPRYASTPQNLRGNASVSEAFLLSRDDEFDDTDLSFIKRMAAIGDSYSAGIGAGNRLGSVFDLFTAGSDYACSRYDHSYPYLVNADERLGDTASRNFQFKSCSGAVIADVVDKQIPTVDANQQVILLSAGGNDVELVNILNQCVYMLGVFNKQQVAVIKVAAIKKGWAWAEGFNWDSLARGCDGQLDYTQALIDGDAFSKSIDRVIDKAKSKLASDGMIYYTGYAKFFADDTSDCDTVSWSSWLFKAHDMQRPYEYLTRARRSRMNSLVEAVNAKIAAAVQRAGTDKVKFVDYDKYVAEWHGRICESGVDESTKESNTRAGLMFYELDTLDPWGSNPWKRNTDGVADGTVEAYQNQLAQLSLLADPDAKLNLPDGAQTAQVSAFHAEMATADTMTTAEIPNLLPDGYGRVFHPQVLLHRIIANLVIYNMVNKNAQAHGLSAVDEDATLDTCPYIPPGSGSAPGSTPDPKYSDPRSAKNQQIALASYIHPLADPDAWSRMLAMDKNKVSVLVANVLNGPDAKINDDWDKAIKSAAAGGKRIIGYVRTGYLGVSQQQFKTRLGSGRLSDWVAQIEQDVDMWYKLYPGLMGGIFFDEGWNSCGSPQNDNLYAGLYEYINYNTKRKYPGAYTVLNPGDFMPKCFEKSADTLLTFESSFERYLDDSIYKPNGWDAADSRKIWHIIYNVPKGEVGRVAALARQRGAGFIEITNDIMPNPYDNLPAADYMGEVMASVNGGTPLVADDPGFPFDDRPGPTYNPPGLDIVSFDYTSASLKWYADGGSFQVAIMGTDTVYNLQAGMREVTIGGLQPGTSYSFRVTALSPGGKVWVTTETKSIKTWDLPDGKTIVNYTSTPSDGSTVIQADVLVPYAFTRLYIYDSSNCDLLSEPAWPVNYNTTNYVCTKYMVEGETLYKYSGQISENMSNAPWAWTSVATISVEVSGYTNKWTLPIGKSTIDTGKFVVQAEGYGPSTNVFQPNPADGSYDCKGSSMCTTPDLLKWCDHAVNTLQRNDDLTYATFPGSGGNDRLTGNCWGDGTRGCGVFIQGGSKCEISGNDMWHAYQNIRDIGGCGKCGSWHRSDGCLVTVNYVSGCNNHS